MSNIVLIILGIISLVAIPKVVDMVTSSKESSVLDSAKSYVKTINNYLVEHTDYFNDDDFEEIENNNNEKIIDVNSLNNVKLKFTGNKPCIQAMEKRFLNIRAGRANPAILDSVVVNYYGTLTPLKQLASISIPEARQLAIKPYDKGSLSAIEKGIYEANIGLNPNNNGEVIILNIPTLTEETRKDFVKQAKGIAEDCKINLRNIRQDANNDIKKLEISEDDIKNSQDEVQELINKYNKIVDEKAKEKETELMTV